MREPTKYRVRAEKTTLTYVYCWSAARKAFGMAQADQPGSFYLNMMAGIFAAFTVEAFLNHLGQQRMKDWETFERKLGPREKLLLLSQVLNISVDLGKRPFQSLYEMLRLRDALAHGKTETLPSDRMVASPDDPSARYPTPKWMTLCDPSSVSRMLEDAERMARELSSKTGSKRDPFASSGYGSAKTSLATKE